jgi:hypothetical protein
VRSKPTPKSWSTISGTRARLEAKKRIGEKSKYDDGYDASMFKHAQSGESVMFTTHLLYGNEYCVFGLEKMRISESNCLHFTGIGIVININICWRMRCANFAYYSGANTPSCPPGHAVTFSY